MRVKLSRARPLYRIMLPDVRRNTDPALKNLFLNKPYLIIPVLQSESCSIIKEAIDQDTFQSWVELVKMATNCEDVEKVFPYRILNDLAAKLKTAEVRLENERKAYEEIIEKM